MSETLSERLDRAFALFEAGNLNAAESIYEETLSREGLPRGETAQCLMGYGYVLCAKAAYEKAAAAYEQLLAMAVSGEERHIALHQLAMVRRESGAYGEALRLVEAEREILDADFPNDALKRAANDYEQGFIRLKAGRAAQAEVWLASSLFYAERSGDLIARACALRGLGEFFCVCGKNAEARNAFGAAKRLFIEAGDRISAGEAEVLADSLSEG